MPTQCKNLIERPFRSCIKASINPLSSQGSGGKINLDWGNRQTISPSRNFVAPKNGIIYLQVHVWENNGTNIYVNGILLQWFYSSAHVVEGSTIILNKNDIFLASTSDSSSGNFRCIFVPFK
jgi:hypothetical protein